MTALALLRHITPGKSSGRPFCHLSYSACEHHSYETEEKLFPFPTTTNYITDTSPKCGKSDSPAETLNLERGSKSPIRDCQAVAVAVEKHCSLCAKTAAPTSVLSGSFLCHVLGSVFSMTGRTVKKTEDYDTEW